MAEPEDMANLRAQLEVISKETSFLLKYFALRKRYEELQQSNESMINKIQHMKRQVKRYKRNKRHFSSILDEHGDNIKDAQVLSIWSEDKFYGSLRTHVPGQDTDSDSDTEIKSRFEHRTALSSIRPLLEAHGLRGLEPVVKSLKVENKDPNAPKKPMNAFHMFCAARRTVIQEEYFKEHNDEIAHHELTKTLAKQWNALVPEEKKVYYDMYEREKERYEREMSNYKPKSELENEGVSSTTSESLTVSTKEVLNSLVKEELDI